MTARPLLFLAAMLLAFAPAGGARAETLFGQAWPEIGGWGDAWGDTVAAPLSPPPAAAAPAVTPVPIGQPVLSGPVHTAPVLSGPVHAAPAQAAPAPVALPARTAAPAPLPPAQPVAPIAVEAPPSEFADGPPGEEPVQLTADQIIHDRELGLVSAVGRVEIAQAGRTLIADNVSYNLKQDVIGASGNVMLIEPGGDVMFSEFFELTGDFKNGTAKEIRVLLSDRSRLAAAAATRVGGDRTDFEDASYTACEPCKKDPSRTPIWQAKAGKVTHNQAEQTIEYRNAWLEMKGIPVIYTPYLSHPDPSVKRKSGFLVPTASMNSTLGPGLTTPYFWAIRDNQDVTFSPRFLFPKVAVSSKSKATSSDFDTMDNSILQSVVLAGEHRWAGQWGETKSQGSLTADKDTGKYRGHLESRGKFHLTRASRAGYQIEHASDDTYNALYNFPMGNERPWYTTRPYVESFGRRSYAMAEAFAFQGNRVTDDPGLSPMVLPHLLYSTESEPGRMGGRLFSESSLLAYRRNEGTDATRLSSTAGWRLPYTTKAGDIYTLSTSVRADGYRAQDLDTGATGGTDSSAFAGRLVPQASLNWRYPFVRPGPIASQTIEPLAMVAFSPNGGNPGNIPNEDSIDFELDEINALMPNRMPGLDRVEGGPRGGYGLRWGVYPRRGGSVVAQLAQGVRTRKSLSEFPANSGFDQQFSDVAGRFDIAPSGNFSLLNRFRLDKDDFNLRRNENVVALGPPAFNVGLSYLFIDQPAENRDAMFRRRHNFSASIRSALTENWSFGAASNFDLTGDGGPLNYTTSLTYADECFAFVGNLRRFYTTDRDLLAGYEFTLNVVLKTLGALPVSVW